MRLPLLLLAAAALPLAAQSHFDRNYDALAATRTIGEVAMAPDGRQAAWADEDHGIFVAGLDPGTPPRLAATGRGLAWSPDSRTLAFLSDAAKSGQLDLYTIAAAGGKPKRLTELTGYLAEPRWAPDGKTLAVLFTADAPGDTGPLQPATGQTGVIGARLYHQRIALVDPVKGSVRQVSPADLYVYEYDWSPDGRTFAATAAPAPGDDNWFIAKLYTIDVKSGKTVVAAAPKMQIADPRWSPDGTRIAYIGGLMSDRGSNGGDIYVVTPGGAPRDVTPGLAASASAVHWLDARRILFGEHADGEPAFATLDLESGRVETLWRGPGAVTRGGWTPDLALARDGKTSAIVRQAFDAPPEVWAGPIGAWRQVSHANPDIRPLWGKAESLHWPSDGRQIQGWLLYPRGYDPKRRWPLVVSVHGGPAYMQRSHWPGAGLEGLLAASGYLVLFPNPRGSFGEGEAFTRANVRDFGYGDFRDLLAGVDEVLRTLPIDSRRVGITGWSYGGYMTMWAVTQTQRFRAAVAGAGLSNFESYYGENQIDQWLIPYFGASVYDDPAIYRRSSPIAFVKNVKTPTLILVGEYDAECPAPQSWEFWHALKTLGVPTELVVYAGEGHAISRPSDQRDIVRRAVEWFDKYLE